MNLVETIKKLSESENFESLLTQMKIRARTGKIEGVTEDMINSAYMDFLNEDFSDGNLLPPDTLILFMQVEEAVVHFCPEEHTKSLESLNEMEIFREMSTEPTVAINESLTLFDLIGGPNG